MAKTKGATQRNGVVKRGRKWAYRVRVAEPSTGKTKQVWVSGFDTERAAREAHDKARASLASGLFTNPSKITLGEYLEKWITLHALTIKPTTEAEYRARIANQISPFIGAMPLSALRPSDVQKLYIDLKQRGGTNGRPLSAKTVKNTSIVLKRALRHAVEVDNLLAVNPALRVPIPKGESRRNELWTREEVHTFLKHCQSHRLFAFYRLAAYTGARRSELLALKWTDLDLEAKKLTISKGRVKTLHGVIDQASTKGGTGRRVVSLDQGTVEALRAHRKQTLEERLQLGAAWVESGYVFVREDGEPIDPDTPSQLFTGMRARLNLPNQRLHDLRHFHATELLTAGVPLHVVAERVGHKDAMVTATIYAHVRPAEAESVADIFAKALG